MKSIIISTLVVFFIVTSSFQAFGEEWTAEQKEVWNVVVADIENFKTGDVDKIMEKRHDDLIIWWSNRVLAFGKKLAPYEYKGWFDFEIPKNWELNPVTIKISGKIAIVAYTYKISGEIFSDSGKNFDVWVKQNNQWLLLGTTGASCEKAAKCPQ